MSKKYSNILLLENINNLSDLEDLIGNQHSELMPHGNNDKETIDSLPDSEKYFIYSWKKIDDIEDVEVPQVENDDCDVKIKFQLATANIEYSKKKQKDDNRNFLPKEERLNKVEVEVLFFERDSKVYSLILTSSEYNLMRTKKLIGYDNISNRNSNYSLESDIFNWLFYIYTEREGILKEELTVENISGFVGNVTDDANVFTGTSHQTTELIVTKAFVSNGGVLKKITIRIRNNDVDLICMINESSTVVLNVADSAKLKILESTGKLKYLLVYLYGYLVLKLKNLYELESENFLNEENPQFSKKIGIDVIESIILKNNITQEEISFSSSEEPSEIER